MFYIFPGEVYCVKFSSSFDHVIQEYNSAFYLYPIIFIYFPQNAKYENTKNTPHNDLNR